MKIISSENSDICHLKCEESLKECMNRGEDESVCRMIQVPCICKCHESL